MRHSLCVMRGVCSVQRVSFYLCAVLFFMHRADFRTSGRMDILEDAFVSLQVFCV